MIGHHRIGAPLTWLVLFVALAGTPLVALGWLGWRLLDQDRALESQRLRERLENAATLAAANWSAVSGPGTRCWRRLREAIGSRCLRVRCSSSSTKTVSCVTRAPRCPTTPGCRRRRSRSTAAFRDAETIELRDRNFSQAAEAYREFGASPRPGVRAAALVRLARVLRRQARDEEALAVYGQLVALGDASVAGAPAALVGLRERVALLKATGRDAAATEEAARLEAALHDGRFRLDRATFDFYQESLPSGHSGRRSAGVGATALADAAAAFWMRWLKEPAGRAAWSN